MKYFNRRTDAAMMPSTFRWNARAALNEREEKIMKYAPLVMKIVNKIDRSEQRVGLLDKHDLIQNGFVGLVEGYDRLDQEISDRTEDADKNDINYLLRNIEGTIKRTSYQTASGVNVSERQILKTKAEMIADKLFGHWLYSFRIDDMELFNKVYSDIDVYMYQGDSYHNEELNDALHDVLWGLSDKERDIIKMSYGIDYKEKFSMREIAEHFEMSEIGVKKSKRRALDKMKNFRNAIILQKFL